MAKDKETVVVTKDKEVAKGVEIDRKSHAGEEIITAIATLGLSELAGREKDDVTIATREGQKVTGKEAEFEKDK